MYRVSNPTYRLIPAGIKGRLLLILGLAALAMGAASAVALVALMQIRGEVTEVERRELPASDAALVLARVGERLQDRTPALVAAKGAVARRHQVDLINRDLSALADETERLRDLYPRHKTGVADIARLAPALAAKLRALGELLERQAALGSALATRRRRLFALHDRVQQLLGPSILAVADVVRRGAAAEPDVFRRAAVAQGPLLEAERLVAAAFAQLLIAAEVTSTGPLDTARGTFARARDQLRALMPGVPSGLRQELDRAVSGLDAELGTGGVFALRGEQLAAAAGAGRAGADRRRIAARLKARVDALVVSASRSVVGAAEAMGDSILRNTLVLVAVSIAVVLLATVLSYRFVVRDISLGLGAVTQAMQRLAAGERDARVPAMERRDEIGDLARVFNVFKDHAFRMETLDRELAEKSRLLLATFENMSDGFTVFDRDGRLVAWNPRWLQLYGLMQDEVEAGAALERILARVADKGARTFTTLGEAVPVSDLAAGRGQSSREFQVRCGDGHLVELRSNPIPGGGFVTLHMDVTERHAMEGQLRQAQKMEAVGQLTGGIAHDFNNILGAILGNLSVLEPALREDADLHERWRRAMGAVDRAARQVERLLAFSRRQHLAPEVVDANELVTGMTDLLEYSLGGGVELRTELAAGLPSLRVDPGQLENALMNLAINARDAMQGSGRIVFSTRRHDAATVEIVVADTGAGIPAELLERVVEPFVTTKPAGKGSGLGLSMVYGFARQSGGDLVIDSRPGQGTRVCILLPVARDAIPAPAASDSGAEPPPRGNGERVLVVDDDPDLLAASVGQLQGLGYRTVTAADAGEALAVLGREADVRLLYTDLVMPGGPDGVALAREAAARWPGLALLLTSAEPRKPEGLPAELLRKPVTLERLARALRRALGKG